MRRTLGARSVEEQAVPNGSLFRCGSALLEFLGNQVDCNLLYCLGHAVLLVQKELLLIGVHLVAQPPRGVGFDPTLDESAPVDPVQPDLLQHFDLRVLLLEQPRNLQVASVPRYVVLMQHYVERNGLLVGGDPLPQDSVVQTPAECVSVRAEVCSHHLVHVVPLVSHWRPALRSIRILNPLWFSPI